MRALVLLLLVGCRTQLLPATDMTPPAPTADLSSPAGQVVGCGANVACSIAAGQHCCEDATLSCSTAACGFREYDCDGPEDCAGGEVCCSGGSGAACSANCAQPAAELCHSVSDCPAGQVCCLDFVLGPGDGMCLSACD